jgi:sodium-dependent dicarboxylate transporter 2/3/5
MDFIKYGFLLWFLSLLFIWVVGFMVVYNIVGFPEGLLETAKGVMAGGAR